MRCYICFEDCNEINCNCELKYAHKSCILYLNNLNCPACKKSYEIPCHYLFYKRTKNFLVNLYFILNELSQYDLINGRRWDE